jgi:hypothetical protein
MIADAADYGLMVLEIAPQVERYEGWRDYAEFLTTNSPVVRQVLRDHPIWYSRLIEYPNRNRAAIG